jgi:hypothetical protein
MNNFCSTLYVTTVATALVHISRTTKLNTLSVVDVASINQVAKQQFGRRQWADMGEQISG